MGKRLSYAVIAAATIVLAVDYGLVMPSMWPYLLSMERNTQEWMLGLCLGAFGLASMISSPLVGWLLDTLPMRSVMVSQIWIGIGANILYSLAPNAWVVMVARFFCGMSSTVMVACNVYIIRTTTEAERSGAFARLMSLQMLGTLGGPALNLGVEMIPRVRLVGTLEMSALSAPGYVVASVLLVVLISVHCFFEEPPLGEDTPKNDENVEASPMRALLRVEIVSLLVCQFAALFSQITLESIVTPISEQYFNWTPLWTSVFFACVTAEVAVAFVVVGMVVHRFQDRVSVLLGWICAVTGVGLLLLFALLKLRAGGHVSLPEFAGSSAVLVLSIPLFESVVGSLFSKMLRARGIQGRGQGVLSTVMSLATVLGPILGGALLTKGLHWVLVAMLSLLLPGFSLFLVSWRRMYISPEVENVAAEPEEGHTETESLLARSDIEI